MCVKCTAGYEVISFSKLWGNRQTTELGGGWCKMSCKLVVHLRVCFLIFSVAHFLPPKFPSGWAVFASVPLPDRGLGGFWGTAVSALISWINHIVGMRGLPQDPWMLGVLSTLQVSWDGTAWNRTQMERHLEKVSLWHRLSLKPKKIGPFWCNFLP